MAGKPLSYYLVPPVLALGAELVAANWYLRPERAIAWASAAAVLVGMAVVFLLAQRRSPSGRAGMCEATTSNILFAALTLVSALAAPLAEALSLITEADLPLRMTMITMGAALVFTGNAMPKTLKPLAAMKCDAAKVQAFQRLSGWTWVLSGLAWMLVWIVLPVPAANSLSVLLLGTGLLIVLAQYVRLFRRPHRL
jgi:hypothetical protein